MSGATAFPAGAWTQTASGRACPLGRALAGEALDMRRDVAIPLGLTGRFANQTPSGVIYSVAQHRSIGADWIMTNHRDVGLALGFLIHDAHEAILGDHTSPLLVALDEQLAALAAEAGVELKNVSVKAARKRLTDPLDAWMHARAGLPWPLPPEAARLIRQIDLQMLMAERRDLLARPPQRWGTLENVTPLKLAHAIKPMPPAKAAEQWLARFDQWSDRLRVAA